MATYDVGLNYTFADGGSVLLDSANGTSSSSRMVLNPSDIVRFTNNHGSFSATIAGQSNARFNTSSLSVSAGTAGNLVVDASPTFANDQSTITMNSRTRTFYYSVISNVDDTPDAFDIGKPVVSANLSTTYEFEPFVVKGINTSVAISIVNGQYKKGASGTWTSSNSTVVLNDIIYCRGTSNSGYASGLNVILTIGTVQDANPITTKNNPDAGERIYFPKTSRPVGISDLTNFFAAPVGHFINPPRYMSAFRRGGQHVPDIPENSSVADTNQANDNTLGDFLTGTATTVYFESYPQNKSDFQLTSNSNPSAQVSWNAENDWSLGYSPLTKYNVEYRYEITENTGAMYGSGVTFAGLNGPAGTYAVNNVGVSVSKSVDQYSEREYSGVIKIFMRSLINTSLVLTSEVSYTLEFYYN
jgi:hypothetical protein